MFSFKNTKYRKLKKKELNLHLTKIPAIKFVL